MGGRVTSNKSVFSSLNFILGLLQCAFVGYVCFTRLPNVTSVESRSSKEGRTTSTRGTESAGRCRQFFSDLSPPVGHPKKVVNSKGILPKMPLI